MGVSAGEGSPAEDAGDARLDAALERLRRRRDELSAKIARLAAEYDAVVGRLSLLERSDAGGLDGQRSSAPPAVARELNGASIRRIAVKVWLSSRPADAPIHYRDWYEVVASAGYSIAGRDPVATFLTQVTRSPLVQHTGKPGEYVLDLHFERRAREELHSLHERLIQAHRPQESYGELPEHRREERRRLTARVEQLERALQEVVEVWGGTERSEAA